MNEETRIAVLENNMLELKTQMSEIRADIKSLGKQVDAVLNQKLADSVEIKAELKSLNERLIHIERQSNLWKWLSPTLSSVITAMVTFLLLNYLQHIK